MFYISHFTQPSSAAKSGYATRRSVSDFPMSPVLFEQRREAAFGGQVNSCPFGSFWASKMNVKYKKKLIALYLDLTLFSTNLSA